MSQNPVLKMNSRGYLVTRDGQFWHRIVCRQSHGVFPAKWVVHHIDGRKLNNEPSNLIAIPKGLHNLIHSQHPNINDLPGRDWIIWKISQWVEDKGGTTKPVRASKAPRGVSKRQHRRERKKTREAKEPTYSAMVRDFVEANPDKVKRFLSEPKK